MGGPLRKDKTTSSVIWSDPAKHKSGFVKSNGIRLNYLDWGGSGPTLILIHGYTDNPHAFDDLAPAFIDRFRVIAYARRGHGLSDVAEPYDTATLTEDLRGLMEALGIAKAHLAGWSMGGNEITAMAGKHPEMVGRIVYLDGAYDWSDPAFVTAWKSMPPQITTPASAMASLDALTEFQKRIWFPSVTDTSRLEANLRESAVIQPDGRLVWRMSDSLMQSIEKVLLSDGRDYTKVRSPALAIYAESFINVSDGDPAWLAPNIAWEQKYMVPFRASSIERVKREMPSVEILRVLGTHGDFVYASRREVVRAMRRFLGTSSKRGIPA
jgi:pimeloyl-ACP methyl ester carboxylesterase